MDKNFMLRCPKCRWAETSTGLSSDLAKFNEIKNSCSNCGKPRVFHCPKCGTASKLTRIKKNGETKA